MLAPMRNTINMIAVNAKRLQYPYPEIHFQYLKH